MNVVINDIKETEFYKWASINNIFSSDILKFESKLNNKKRKRNKDNNSLNIKWTHYLLCGGSIGGGCLYIHDEKYSDFLKILSRDVEMNKANSLALSEQRSKVFRMYFDLDYYYDHNDESIINENIENNAIYIQDIVKSFYEPEENNIYKFNMVILTRSISKKDENYSKGVHLIFYKLNVNRKRALYIRNAVISKLYEKYGKLKIKGDTPFGGWDNVVDESVYINNGLRMIYSKNVKKCKNCVKIKSLTNSQSSIGENSNSSIDYCEICHNTKKVLTNDYYDVYKIIDSNGKEVNIKLKIEDKFKISHIRLPNKSKLSTGWKSEMEKIYKLDKLFINDDDDDDDDENIENEFSDKNNYLKIGKLFYELRNDDIISIDFNIDNRWDIIMEYIRNYKINNEKPYIDVNIWKIKKSQNKKEGKYFCIYVDGRGSKWCKNKNMDHNSANIYFKITKIGSYAYILQKCTCRCRKNEDKEIECSKYNNLLYKNESPTIISLFDDY